MSSVACINIVCKQLIEIKSIKCTNNQNEVFKNFWLLNCVVYSAIISWFLFNNIKCKKNNAMKSFKNPEWLEQLEMEIKNTRKFISQCVSERLRLTTKGRLTRKSKRNRQEMLKCLKEGDTISCVNITILIEKSKNKLRRLAASRKRKLKNAESTKLNTEFKLNQKSVYDKFKQNEDEATGDATPTYKKVGVKEGQIFENVDEVVNFWAGIWEKEDSGNSQAPWIDEIEQVFKNIVPVIDTDPIPITEAILLRSIKKKKNWSAPGPDLIVNFWWKHLTSTHKLIAKLFYIICNKRQYPEVWFPLGRVALIPKEGEWSVPNQRPITCTNTIYKWYTSVLLHFKNQHLKKYHLMQIDQRGAKADTSGTSDNLLIDDTVIRDATIHKRNLSCAWVDVRKAFDSLSHSYLKRALNVHRLPSKLQDALIDIINNWYVTLSIPTSEGVQESRIIKFSNGELQGDSLGPAFYTLAKNPPSWVIRQRDGYTLSAPIKKKVTHTLFVDDLKKYDKSKVTLTRSLELIRNMMADAGLLWNEKKCKCVHMKKGKVETEEGDVVLSDGFKVKCLQSTDTYKFLGVPENTAHDISNLSTSMLKVITGRANIVWSSPLSDYNKVMATNIFVNSVIEYFFWSERFNIDDLKKMDICVREALVKNGAKHYQQMNDLLYLTKNKGGKGLKSIEQSYKETKVKSAVKLLQSTDQRMDMVKQFHRICMNTKHYSLFKDAIKYANEIGIKLDISPTSYSVKFVKDNVTVTTTSVSAVKSEISRSRNEKHETQIMSSTWQGVNYKTRKNDVHLQKGCFDWLKTWKNCPSHIIRSVFDLYCQTLNTKTFQLIRSKVRPDDTLCRLCKEGEESVMHLLNRCPKLLKSRYLQRHNQVLKSFFYEMLFKYGLIDHIPPWFTESTPKPFYQNDEVSVWWDIPEFAGANTEEEREVFRPDGKLKLLHEKIIYLIEITISWIDNREERYEEKNNKYVHIMRNIKRVNPEYKVEQITLVMDSLGGYSKCLKDNIGKVFKKQGTISKIIHKMQKAVLSESVRISRCFKLSTRV